MYDNIVQFYCGGHGMHDDTIEMTSLCTFAVTKQPGSSILVEASGEMMCGTLLLMSVAGW